MWRHIINGKIAAQDSDNATLFDLLDGCFDLFYDIH